MKRAAPTPRAATIDEAVATAHAALRAVRGVSWSLCTAEQQLVTAAIIAAYEAEKLPPRERADAAANLLRLVERMKVAAAVTCDEPAGDREWMRGVAT